jgi:4-azaleucine resistance transporter AzlC
LFKALKAAFPYTVPVLVGYFFLGTAFGILLQSKGYHAGWAFLMAVFIYAGSMQFAAVGLLSGPFSPLGALVMTLGVNSRHSFYGLSLFGHFKELGFWKKLYAIFAVTDESYALLCSISPPEGVRPEFFWLAIEGLNQLYWVAGCVAGGLAGALLRFDTRGVDFMMTALFVVLFSEQWKTPLNRPPAVIGLSASVCCLFFFGPAGFILPAIALIVFFMTRGMKALEGRCAR